MAGLPGFGWESRRQSGGVPENDGRRSEKTGDLRARISKTHLLKNSQSEKIYVSEKAKKKRRIFIKFPLRYAAVFLLRKFAKRMYI